MLKKLLNETYDEIKKEENLEKKALELAKIFFTDKLDKGKKPYMEHLLKLRDSVDEENRRLFHQLAEQCNISIYIYSKYEFVSRLWS